MHPELITRQEAMVFLTRLQSRWLERVWADGVLRVLTLALSRAGNRVASRHCRQNLLFCSKLVDVQRGSLAIRDTEMLIIANLVDCFIDHRIRWQDIDDNTGI